MTYKELYESAINKLEKGEITLGEFEKMIEPLNAEVGGDTDTISRQAAIDVVKGIDTHFVKYIQQLPSALPEPCEDAVSRKVVCDWIDECQNHADKLYGYEEKALANVKRFIVSLPSVTPKQRTGKWIKLDMHRGMADHKCTACEQECYVPTCMGEPLYAFCPNCGSYNGGEQDDKCRQV